MRCRFHPQAACAAPLHWLHSGGQGFPERQVRSCHRARESSTHQTELAQHSLLYVAIPLSGTAVGDTEQSRVLSRVLPWARRQHGLVAAYRGAWEASFLDSFVICFFMMHTLSAFHLSIC